jgi:hypothetical protein
MDARSRPESGQTTRPAGNVDEDANPPLTDPDTSDPHSEGETVPPKDTGSAVPPYEGRQQSAK